MSDQLVFRNTAEQKGRNLFATPENSPLKYLSCGRIILDMDLPEVTVDPGGQESGIICLDGEGEIEVDGRKYTLKKYDTLYLPPDKVYTAKTSSFFNAAECLAPAEEKGDVIFIPFKKIKNDPDLSALTGEPTFRRQIYKMIDTNVPASRLLAGVTLGDSGNWTSWIPHEHARSKEEVYLYIDMPRPAYGLQLIYDDEGETDLVYRVFQDDAVVITRGYHPNVGIPGCGIKFVWMMAAYSSVTDRDWSDMRFQEGL